MIIGYDLLIAKKKKKTTTKKLCKYLLNDT